MNKFAPYIVSFIAFLLCVGLFVFGGFKWEDRGFGWEFIFFWVLNVVGIYYMCGILYSW